MSVAALIVAAGRGFRAGSGVPKQYRSLAGQTILARTVEAFLSHPRVNATLVVIHPEDRALYERAIAEMNPGPGIALLAPTDGGDTRQDSVRRGLAALTPHGPDLVLVHDAARPFVDAELIDRAIEVGGRFGAGVPGIGVSDTVKIVGEGGIVSETPMRARLRAIQTPQAFAYSLLVSAHGRAAQTRQTGFTDDGALMEWAGHEVRVFEGAAGNMKLTHEGDFAIAENLLKESPMTLLTRLGTGFDVHAFSEGDHIWLGGLRIPHERGVLAHSDGDVILHALTDAVLGALADGDIGTHFPPSDPQWKGAASDRFLAHAIDLVRARGGVVDHLDATLLCERPKLGPHRDAMRARIAAIAGLRVEQVSVKATTTEKLGFTGRSEGIAAQAAATIRLPEVAA